VSERPSPQDYVDFRSYLRDLVAHLKSTTRSFSYRAFARRGGFSSSGFLKHVIEGQRNLSLASIRKVTKGLSLSEQEARAFELLVHLDRASTDEEKTALLRRLRASKLRKRLRDDEFELYSSWWVVPVRELLTMDRAPQSPKAIARRIWPRIKLADARRALALLERLGLVRTETRDAALKSPEGTLETPAEVKSLAVRNYHRAMLSLAADSLDSLPREDRNVTSITLRMTGRDYRWVCQRISEFEDELLTTLGGNEPTADEAEIHNVCVSVVPVTRREDS
jgi:uncharacterized protein (TIGR02147 family)